MLGSGGLADREIPVRLGIDRGPNADLTNGGSSGSPLLRSEHHHAGCSLPVPLTLRCRFAPSIAAAWKEDSAIHRSIARLSFML